MRSSPATVVSVPAGSTEICALPLAQIAFTLARYAAGVGPRLDAELFELGVERELSHPAIAAATTIAATPRRLFTITRSFWSPDVLLDPANACMPNSP